jgi:hypothetical protein
VAVRVGWISWPGNIGGKAYDSYVTDGHYEYFGTDGQQQVGPPFHEVFPVADACNKDWFLRYMQQVEQEGIGYAEARQFG